MITPLFRPLLSNIFLAKSPIYSFSIRFLFCACVLNIWACQPRSTEPDINLLVGTFTDGNSEGIYLLKFNTSTGALGEPTLAVKAPNPSYLAIDEQKDLLYSVEREDTAGFLSQYSLRGGNGEFRMISRHSTFGAGPCHIVADVNIGLVAVSNYGGGNIVIYPIEDNGNIGGEAVNRSHAGQGPVGDRQSGPHAHFSAFYKGRLYSVDLGIDQVLFYPLLEGDSIGEENIALQMDPGDGPRHLVFHSDQPWVYVVNELSSTVIAAKVNETGKFDRLQKISTLPSGFEGINQCADIRLSADGHFLYVSNRGHNSIAMFTVGLDGELKLIGHTAVEGDWPRNFTFTPDGRFMLVANRRSGNIAVFQVDESTGLPRYTGIEQEVPSPACLLFYN